MRLEVVNDLLVRRLGDAGATKLVCLHGFADSGSMFLPLSETELANHFELVLVDLPVSALLLQEATSPTSASTPGSAKKRSSSTQSRRAMSLSRLAQGTAPMNPMVTARWPSTMKWQPGTRP